MSKSIIAGNPDFKRTVPAGETFVDVSEFFFDTIQGEGITLGHPAAFLRVQSCTLACIFCDTQEVWRFGNPYTITELLDLIDSSGLAQQLEKGQHLVLTGGSPLKQQKKLITLIEAFIHRFKFKPYIEVENECVLLPYDEMVDFVDCWNNSPKLENSGNVEMFRYQPNVLAKMSSLDNSWFKFVVGGEEEWQEIQEKFLDTNLIRRDQIILMPLGATREELQETRERAVQLAIREGVRYCTREHVILWDKKTGV